MEFLFLLLVGAMVALFISNSGLKARVVRLEALAASGAAPEQAPVAPAALEAAAAVEEGPAVIVFEPDGVLADAPPPKESLGGLFERLVAGRLLIWLGGAALILSAVFLIRYSIEIGLVTPGLRMLAAAAFGLFLLAVGEYARTGRLLADDPRIAQALVGAGLAVLYATAYGSHVLYGLIGPATASGAMLAITAGALALALRHGAPTAVMGLIGGFLTPLLVGDPNADAVPLLAYIALLDLAVFAVAWRRGWTWLAAAAVALSFVWTAFLLVRPPDDALAAGLFVVALALAAALLRLGEGRQLALIQPLAIGIVQLAALVARTDIGAPAWALYAALAAAAVALAARRREFWLAPPLALGLALALLLAKAATGQDPFVPWAAAGITLLFGGAGLGLALRRPRLWWTLVGTAGFAGPALILRAVRPELLDRPAWGALTAALALGPALIVWANRRRATAKVPADPALLAAGAGAALLAGAAVWDLAGADLVAAGWLLIALGAALAARRLGDLALGTVAVLAAIIAVLRVLWMVPELSTAAITGLVGEPVLAADLPGAATAGFALALPALLLAGLRLALPPLPLGAGRAMPAIAGLFAIAAFYVWFKQAFGLADAADFAARGMIERTIVTQMLFLAGWLLASGIVRPPRIEPGLLRWAGTALTVLAAARLVWFDILLHNPAWRAQWVGTLPLLNLILVQYLLGAAWLYAARRRAEAATRSGLWLGAFLAALLVGVALLVRQAFHGAILTGADMPIAEFYVYSLAGLLVAIGLLVAGIRLPDKALRLAGLILLTATIVKVFLVDASALDGVLRILSFLGLGIALIGIGRLYGPVLRAERERL